MKLLYAHPLRDWWLRLKALTAHEPRRAKATTAPLKPKPARRTIVFLELP